MESKTYCVWLLSAFFGFGITNVSARECILGSDSQIIQDEEGTGVSDSDIYAVDGAGASCGKKTSFLNTYKLKNNIVTVTIGGIPRAFLALALYDKDSAPKCNQIKVRSACFKPPGDGRVGVELYDVDTPSKGRVVFTFDGNGKPIEKYPEYALVRAQFGSKPVVVRTRIGEAVKTFQEKAKSCAGDPDSKLCRGNREAVAENVVLERLRMERLASIGKPAVEQDYKKFNQRFSAVGGIEGIIQEMMMGTELGTLSPYELSDATKGRSGLSFGVHQLDIGSNDEAKAIFNKNRDDYARNPQWKDKRDHRTFIYGEAIKAPVQGYRVRQLFLVHDAMPTLQDMMRADAAMKRLEDDHRKFLRKGAETYAELRAKKCFQQSPFLALVAIDRRNQHPVDYDPIVDTVAARCEQRVPLPAIEDEITKFYGDYTKRADTIRALIRRKNLI
jgi:hypothetical protein